MICLATENLKERRTIPQMTGNEFPLDRVYLRKPSNEYLEGIWVDSVDGVERRCWRCGEKELVWVVYSFSDRVYMRLCILDLSIFTESGLIKPRSNGPIPTKDGDFPLTLFPTKYARLDREEFG